MSQPPFVVGLKETGGGEMSGKSTAERENNNAIPYEEVVKWAQNPPLLKPDVKPVGWAIFASAAIILLWYFFLYRSPAPGDEEKDEEESAEKEESEEAPAEAADDSPAETPAE